jgi:protease-4
MRVNSPGGSAVGSDLVWRATLEARRRGKPLVVSMGDVAGSGGYYVSMAADAIVAEAATITGSIGVVNVKLSLRDLFARLGIGIDYAKSDELSDALSPWRPMTESELAQLNKLAGEMYAVFTRKVAEGRRLEPERTELVARGRVWSGTAARANGLVDELGGLERAILIAREKAGLRPSEACEVIPFPQPTTLSGLRLALAPAQMPGLALGVTARSMGVPAEWIPAMLRLLTETRALLLCPFF